MEISMDFPENFFEEEVICDYVVTEKYKKIWACELDLANALLDVCRRHKIKVMAFAGTVLGAVRHKGFIPWDDDMDFCMLREDYERFIKIAPDEWKEPYFLQTALTDNRFFFGYARLRNSSTTALIENFTDKNYNCGIYIDIFVLDGYIYDDSLLDRQLKLRDQAFRKASLFCRPRPESFVMKKWMKKLLCLLFSSATNYEKEVANYNRIMTLYEDRSDRVTILTHSKSFLSKYWFKRDSFEHIILMPFENIMLPIPADYHEILTTAYGDYMECPPVEERGKWHEGQIIFDPDIPYLKYLSDVGLD